MTLPQHPKTKKQVGYFLRAPTNSLLILGNIGSGKLDLAESIAAELLDSSDLNNQPYFMHVKKPAAKQDISIDTVREVTRFLRLKALGDRIIRRVVLVENAQYLSIEAQNALLKVLEEPNSDTVFILTAPSELSLLPTIVSRCRQIMVHPLALKQALDFYSGQYSAKQINSAWQLSQGSSSLLNAVLKEDDGHPLKRAVEDVKQFLKLSRYERLLKMDALVKDREYLNLLLEALAKILTALHHSAIEKQTNRASIFLSDRRKTRQAQEAITVNANLKLTALWLVHNLRS